MSEGKQSFEDIVMELREKILDVATDVKETKRKLEQSEADGKEDTGEEYANLMLAYRHLEDARMRLGKVLQARDGGVSVYDKAEAPAEEPVKKSVKTPDQEAE